MITIFIFCTFIMQGVSCGSIEFATPAACTSAKEVWISRTRGVQTKQFCVLKVTGQEV